MRAKKQDKHFPWYVALLTCIVLGVITFSLVSVVTAPSLPVIDECADGGENADFSCNDGEGDNAFVIPSVPLENPYAIPDSNLSALNGNDYFPGIQYRGVTLAGGECKGELGAGGVFMPVDNDAELFIYKGMNVFRIPILWEHIGYANGTFYPGCCGAGTQTVYLTKLDALIKQLTDYDAIIVLDLHNDMKYNGTEIRVDPNAPGGYLGSGIGQLWRNLAMRYPSPRMMYGVMHITVPESSFNIYNVVRAAVTGIRNAEQNGFVHYLLLPVVDIFAGTSKPMVLTYKDIPNVKRYAIEAVAFFGKSYQNVYPEDECLPANEYIQTFNRWWPAFMDWVRDNKQTIFFTEFGAPATPNCKIILSHFLAEIHKFPYTNEAGYGVWGWIAWAAGLPGCRLEHSIVSLAPGYPANTLMWDNTSFYPKYLKPLDTPIPPLSPGRLAIRVLNTLPYTLSLLSGYVPFQIRGSANAGPGQYAYLYSSNKVNTPNNGLQSHYSVPTGRGYIGFGFSPPDEQQKSEVITFVEENCANFANSPCDIVVTHDIVQSTGARCLTLLPSRRCS